MLENAAFEFKGIQMSQSAMHWKIVTSLASGVCLLAVAATAIAQQAMGAAPNDKTAKTLIAFERQWAEQECTNKIVIYTILADDFEGTSPSGKRYKKPAPPLPSNVSAASKIEARDCHVEDVAVHFYGEAMAVVYGSEGLERLGQNHVYEKHCLIWTDTWLKRNGVWQIVAAQDTKSACK